MAGSKYNKNKNATGGLVAGSISNLIGGVSQQPWNVRMPSQAEEQINCHATITEFMRRRPATKLIKEINPPEGTRDFVCVKLDRDETDQYIAMFSGDGIKVFDLNGKEQTVQITDSGLEYLSEIKNAKEDLCFCPIKDYLFCVNKQVKVKRSEDSGTPRTPECVVFVKQASWSTKYTLKLGGTKVSYTTASGTYEEGTTPPTLSANDILTQLKTKMEAKTDAYTIVINGSSMWIKKTNSSKFSFATSSSRDEHIYSFRKESRKIEDLPVVAPDGMVVRITGDSTTDADDYYVTFDANTSGTFGSGSWVESADPTNTNAFNAGTMPHALKRIKAHKFKFDAVDWEDRESGDDSTNPFPSFTGRAIEGIFYYRNRIGFLAGDNVIMSRANDLMNFFISSVTTITDADPIDIAASGTSSSNLYGVAPLPTGLIFFSTQGQYLLEHDTVLSNSTVSLTPITHYESDDKAYPVSSGKTIFFASKRGMYGDVKEYVAFDSDDLSSSDATDILAHAPTYIHGTINDLQCSSNEEILLVRTEDDPNSIYVYKYFWNGNEKAQSAWYKWEFSGSIMSVLFFNTKVYLIVDYDVGGMLTMTMETLDLEPRHKDDGEDFEYCLDRKVSDSSMTKGTYDQLTKTTTITLPYWYEGMKVVVRSDEENDLKAGTILNVVSRNNKTITVKHKITNKTRLYAGIPFKSTYAFTTLGIRNQNNTAITTGRLQLRNLYLNINDTGYIKVEVKPKGKDSSVYTFTGKRLGDSSSTIGDIPLYNGQISIPVLSRNIDTSIAITSDSYLPFAIVNADWEGFYTSRHTRV